MNKTQTFEFLTQIVDQVSFKSNKDRDLYLSIIKENFEPKAGGGQVQNPSYIEDGVTYHYCRYLTIYVPEDDIVMSSGKSKGYSKIAISRWTKAGKEAKVLQEKALKLLLEGKQIEGQDANTQAEELLIARNKPEFYQDLVEAIQDDSIIVE